MKGSATTPLPGLQAVIFDFDGVIADSEPLHFRSFREVLAEERIELTEEAYYTRFLGLSDAAAFVAIAGDRGTRWDRARLAASIGRAIAPSRSVAIEDSRRGLESARAAGLKTIAVAPAHARGASIEADMVVDGLAALKVTDLQRIVAD